MIGGKDQMQQIYIQCSNGYSALDIQQQNTAVMYITFAALDSYRSPIPNIQCNND